MRYLNRMVSAALVAAVSAGAIAQQSPPTEPAITIGITVVGRTEPGPYAVPNATTATKVDMPVMETPASIQVVPQQVLRDQQATRLEQAVKNVSGVYSNNLFFGQFADEFVIRGFRTAEVVFRDGFRIDSLAGKRDLANIEQVEIVKGPASVLYGRMEPGGMINYVTKKPQATAAYSIEQQIGSYNTYITTVDMTGSLAADDRVSYRLNVGYEDSGSFREFVGAKRTLIAPVVDWRIAPGTLLRLEYEYFNNKTTPDNIGLIAYGNRPLDIPHTRNLAEPTDFQNATQNTLGLTLFHDFNDRWKLAVRAQGSKTKEKDGGAYGDYVTDADIDLGILPRTVEGSQTGLAETGDQSVSAAEINLTGRFQTGNIGHTLLLGADYRRSTSDFVCCGINGDVLDDISIFNPVHGVTLGPVTFGDYGGSSVTKWYGLFVQDQIELPGKIYALAGIRYDSAEESSGGNTLNDHKFSPRIGLLWRASNWLSIFGAYVENFGAGNGSLLDPNDQPLKPETARQTEFGVKTEFFGGKLVGSAVLFDLTKQNIAVDDPSFPPGSNHALTVGEANSRGLEIDLAGEIHPGWNLIAAYAYTKTRILNDSSLGIEGNQLPNVPQSGGRIWTTYTFQGGDLAGLMFGGGVTARGQRQGNLDNDFQLPGYATVDLVARYAARIGATRFTAQLNVNNVFDRNYFESSADCCRSRIMPGTPLSVMGALRLDF